jgi:hypothetical protein
LVFEALDEVTDRDRGDLIDSVISDLRSDLLVHLNELLLADLSAGISVDLFKDFLGYLNCILSFNLGLVLISFLFIRATDELMITLEIVPADIESGNFTIRIFKVAINCIE